MKIEVIVCQNRKVFAFNPAAMDMINFLSNIDIDTQYYLVASNDDKFYASDFSLIFNQVGPGCTTWSQLETKLTEGILLGARKKIPPCYYMWDIKDGRSTTSPIPDGVTEHNLFYKTESINIISFDNTNSIEADFGSKDSPGIRNLVNYKSKLPDVIFKKVDPTFTINFKNTIPIINGVSIYPLYYEANNELFAPFGVQYLPNHINKNILLVDFSDIGNIDVIKLSECTRIEPFTSDSIIFDLPTNKTMAGKSVIMVLGGRWYFEYDFHKCSDKRITFYPKQEMHNSLISNRIYSKDYDNQFTMTSSHLDYYISTTMWESSNYNNYVILVDNPKMKVVDNAIGNSDESISPLSVNNFRNNLLDSYRNVFFTHPSGVLRGLLMRDLNRDIVDYIKVNKHSKDVIMIHPSSNIVIADFDIGYVENALIKTYGTKISNSPYTMRDIFSVI